MVVKDNNIVHGIYSEEELRTFFDVVKTDGDVCFCIKNSSMVGSDWKYFAVLRFNHSKIDNSDIHYECFWFGEGPAGSLRECRHSYFGSSPSEIDGYVFYINREIINKAFDYLEEYYDLD